MKASNLLIPITSLFLIAITIGAVKGNDFGLLIVLILLGQVSLVAMLISVLKDPQSTSKTFDEYFYEDQDYKRNQSQ